MKTQGRLHNNTQIHWPVLSPNVDYPKCHLVHVQSHPQTRYMYSLIPRPPFNTARGMGSLVTTFLYRHSGYNLIGWFENYQYSTCNGLPYHKPLSFTDLLSPPSNNLLKPSKTKAEQLTHGVMMSPDSLFLFGGGSGNETSTCVYCWCANAERYLYSSQSRHHSAWCFSETRASLLGMQWHPKTVNNIP